MQFRSQHLGGALSTHSVSVCVCGGGGDPVESVCDSLPTSQLNCAEKRRIMSTSLLNLRNPHECFMRAEPSVCNTHTQSWDSSFFFLHHYNWGPVCQNQNQIHTQAWCVCVCLTNHSEAAGLQGAEKHPKSENVSQCDNTTCYAFQSGLQIKSSYGSFCYLLWLDVPIRGFP